MANTDGFINEVNEEVRRDRMTAMFRRWAPVGVLLVIAIVGGAAWVEWSRARETARAEAFGDAVLAAQSREDPQARRAALSDIEADVADRAGVLGLLTSGTAAGDDGAVDPAALLALADTPGLAPVYRDLAVLKAMLAGGSGDAARDAALLDEIATPGRPYRHLAIERQAMVAIATGDEATALTLLRLLTQEAGVTQSLRRRAAQTIVALGAEPEPA